MNEDILEELRLELVKKNRNTDLIGLIMYEEWKIPEFQN